MLNINNKVIYNPTREDDIIFIKDKIYNHVTLYTPRLGVEKSSNKLILGENYLNCTFDCCDLDNIAIKDCTFKKCLFKRCDLNHITLLDCSFKDCVFEDCNIQSLVFNRDYAVWLYKYDNIESCCFHNTVISGILLNINIIDSVLDKITLCGVNSIKTTFANNKINAWQIIKSNFCETTYNNQELSITDFERISDDCNLDFKHLLLDFKNTILDNSDDKEWEKEYAEYNKNKEEERE